MGTFGLDAVMSRSKGQVQGRGGRGAKGLRKLGGVLIIEFCEARWKVDNGDTCTT